MVHSGYIPSPSPNSHAVVSALYSDSYAIAVAVLGHSTRHANVSARLILPYIDGRVSSRALCIARAVGWEPHAVPFIPPPHNGKDIYHRFKDVYTKLNLWSLDKMGVDRLVYLDADTLVRGNFDELFDIPFDFAAVGDVYGDKRGFAVTFNTGVLVLRPDSAVLGDIKRKLETAVYPLGEADQAFLNLYFAGTAVRLPYAYNANLAIKKRSPALWGALEGEMRVVHYTLVKPFFAESESESGLSRILTEEELGGAVVRAGNQYGGLYREEVGWWWAAYERMMREEGGAIGDCSRE
jgi:inositol phosphorylceramide glucuronosyltransferase 1